MFILIEVVLRTRYYLIILNIHIWHQMQRYPKYCDSKSKNKFSNLPQNCLLKHLLWRMKFPCKLQWTDLPLGVKWLDDFGKACSATVRDQSLLRHQSPIFQKSGVQHNSFHNVTNFESWTFKLRHERNLNLFHLGNITKTLYTPNLSSN